jgi:diguanylate cyclase (GGDEF)-like protein
MWLALSGVYIVLWLNLYDNIPKPHSSLVIGLGLILAVLGGLKTMSRNRQVDALNRLQSHLHHQARHDSMTGLGNRTMLRAAETEFPRKHAAAAIVMDLDGFKDINDNFGHAAGDTLLVEVADRLRRIVREPDILIRLGGDEFAVLLRDVTQEQADAIAMRITEDICTPMRVDGRTVDVGASIGVATSSKPRTTSLEHLLQEADAAMYHTKHRARRRIATSTPHTTTYLSCRHAIDDADQPKRNAPAWHCG